MGKVILSADSTCDLGNELLQRHNVQIYPLHVHIGDREYRDGIDITGDEIYRIYEQQHLLPKTAAVNTQEFLDHFQPWTDQGYEVVHVSIGSGLSSSYQNAVIAAQELPGVHVVDSCSLSTGIGLLVIEAAQRIAAGLPGEQVAREVQALTDKVRASFVIDSLEFLREGGRCSALAAFGANLLNLKPCIQVSTKDGSMGVGRKYRGKLEKVLRQYAQDKLADEPNRQHTRAFITHSGIAQERIDLVKNVLEEQADFEEIHITRAGSTISAHCGPNTLGVLFMVE